MQPTTLIILAVGLLTGQSYAITCKNGLLYCGSNLVVRKGWSFSDVQSAYQREKSNNGPAPTDFEVWGSLFKCTKDGNKLKWVNGRTQCGYCVYGGDGRSDYCA
jgi:hypothetical protein